MTNKNRCLFYLMLIIFIVLFAISGIGCGQQSGVSDDQPDVTVPEEEVEVLVFKLAHALPPVHMGAVVIQEFADYINENDDSILIEVYGGLQLGGDRSMMDQILADTLEIAVISAVLQATVVPEMNVLSLPMVFDSETHFYNVVQDEEFFSMLASITRDKAGYEVISAIGGMGRGILNKVRPIRTPDDLRGLTLRVIEGPLFTDIWTNQGAITATIPLPELYAALQQGVVDAEDNTIDMSYVMKLTELQPYATDLGMSYQVNPVIVSEGSWAKLNDEQRELFREAGRQMDAKYYERYLQMKSVMMQKATEEHGVEIIKRDELTEEELNLWRENAKPVIEKYTTNINPEFNKLFWTLIEKYR